MLIRRPILVNAKLYEILQFLKSNLISFPFLATLVFALLAPFWIPAEIYLLLRTFLFDPNGIIAWILGVGGVGTFLFLSVRMLVQMGRKGKQLRFLRQASREGVPGAAEAYAEHQRKMLESRPMSEHCASWLALAVSVPVYVSLFVWNEMTAPSVVHNDGKTILLSKHDVLVRHLKFIEKDGVFTWLKL